MQEDCCICYENFENKKIFTSNTFYDFEKIKSEYKTDELAFQLNCKCNGSIYHIECLKNVIFNNYLDCLCCYCRTPISLMDKTRINGYYRDIDNRPNDIDEIEFYRKKFRKTTQRLIYSNMIFNIFIYFYILNTLGTYINGVQKLNIIMQVFELRLLLWLKDEPNETHHEVLNLNMFLTAMSTLIVLFMQKELNFIAGSYMFFTLLTHPVITGMFC